MDKCAGLFAVLGREVFYARLGIGLSVGSGQAALDRLAGRSFRTRNLRSFTDGGGLLNVFHNGRSVDGLLLGLNLCILQKPAVGFCIYAVCAECFSPPGVVFAAVDILGGKLICYTLTVLAVVYERSFGAGEVFTGCELGNSRRQSLHIAALAVFGELFSRSGLNGRPVIGLHVRFVLIDELRYIPAGNITVAVKLELYLLSKLVVGIELKRLGDKVSKIAAVELFVCVIHPNGVCNCVRGIEQSCAHCAEKSRICDLLPIDALVCVEYRIFQNGAEDFL